MENLGPKEILETGEVCFLLFACISVWLETCWLVWVQPSNQTKADRDLKFGTHTCLGHIKKQVFRFFEKVTIRAVSFEKLVCHVDFSHISSVLLSYIYHISTCLRDLI